VHLSQPFGLTATTVVAVLETAKAIWQVAHPDRERLDVNFEERFRLKIFGLQPGSVIVPLEREYEVKKDDFLAVREDDEFDRATALTLGAIRAVSEDDLLPDDLPRSVLPHFEPLGSTLRPDERVRIVMPGTEKGATILPSTGSRFRSRMVEEYTDTITIEGEVRSANLDSRTFTIRLRNDTKVSGKYNQIFEQEVVRALHRHQDSQARLEVKATFQLDGTMKRIDKVLSFKLFGPDDDGFDESARPIWEVVEGIGKAIPDEEWAKLPDDASIHLDHYLYGHRRREE
jgi:hypothetical protein